MIAPLIQDLRCDTATIEDTRPNEGDLSRPNRFIWALTLTAGISGLLFGYECVASPRWSSKWVLTMFQHRCDIFHSGLDRWRPRACAYHPGYELHHFLHQFLCPLSQSGCQRVGRSSWSEEGNFGCGHLVYRRSLMASHHFIGWGDDCRQKRGRPRSRSGESAGPNVRRGLHIHQLGWVRERKAEESIDTFPSFRHHRVEDDWSR